MAKPYFERPMLPVPTKEIERLPYAKPGCKRRIFYCPKCGRMMLGEHMDAWAEANSDIFYGLEFKSLVKHRYNCPDYFRVMSCIKECGTHIGFGYSKGTRPEQIITRITTEELYDLVVESDADVPF